MEKHIENLKTLFEVFVVNAEKSSHNKAAGVRARKAALDLVKGLKEYRKLSIEASHSEK